MRMASRLPQTQGGSSPLLAEVGIVELRALVGGDENQHLRVERAIGARAREEKKSISASVRSKIRPDGPMLHAMWADLEPGTSASDCSSA